MKDNGPKVVKTEDVVVGAGLTAYGSGIEIIDVDTFGVHYKVACTGTPNVKIQFEQSIDGTNWFVPNNAENVATAATDKLDHGKALSLAPFPWVRFKLTEITTTVPDTVVTLDFTLQRKSFGNN